MSATQQLLERLETAGIRKGEIAAALSVSPSAVSDLFSGKRQLKFEESLVLQAMTPATLDSGLGRGDEPQNEGPISILIDRIADRLFALNTTERAVSMEATGQPDALRYIRSRKAMPSAARLSAIAQALDTSTEWLLGADDQEPIKENPGECDADEAGDSLPAERLQKARADAGYASAALAAQAMGWKESGYRHHENGTREFGRDRAMAYARAFNVSASWLLGIKDNPSPHSTVFAGHDGNQGKVLRELRKSQGLALRAVAEAVGTHFTTIAKIERGERRMSLEMATALAPLLKTTVAELIGTGDEATAKDILAAINRATAVLERIAASLERPRTIS